MSQIVDSIEYSVCEDCLLAIAHGETDHDIGDATERELNGRTGHFSPGVEQTEEDPDGTGYDEFSWRECELCRSTLGGSRHGVTLLITGNCPQPEAREDGQTS